MVAEAPPSGAAMHCKQSRGTQIGDTLLSIPAAANKQLHLVWLSPSSAVL